MLVSLGYTKDDIIEKLADPLEWKEQMDKEAYKKTARTELEKNEYKYFLDSIGMIYL
jgi:hypothetical protein